MGLRIMSIVAIPVLLFFASCGYSSSDVIASYQDGNKKIKITRGEFYNTFGGNKRYMSYVLRDKNTQARFLSNYALKRLKAIDAARMGLDKGDAYQTNLKAYVENRMLIPALLKDKFPQELKTFSVPGYKIRHIIVKRSEYKTVTQPDPHRFKKMAQARKKIKDSKKLQKRLQALAKATIRKRVKLSAFELRQHEAKISAKIKKIEAELKKKGVAAFPQLARAYCEDGSKMKGGDLGYIFPHQSNMDKKFLKAALALKPGQVTGVVNTQFGYHLIKCDAIVQFTEKNFDKYFPSAADKKRLAKAKGKSKKYLKRRIDFQTKRVMRKIWFSSVWAFIDDIVANDKNVVNNRAKLASGNPKAVVFQINHPEYKFSMTKGDLVAKMKKIPPYRLRRFGIKRSAKDKSPYTVEELQAFFDWDITMPVLKYGAYKTGVVKSEKFKESLASARLAVLERLYNKKVNDQIKVTDKEIQAEYKKYPKRYKNYTPRLYKPRPKRGGGRPLNYLQAKKLHAENILRNQKRTRLLDRLNTELKKRYALKIDESKFEIRKQKPSKRRLRRRMPRRRVIKKKAAKKGVIKKKK